MLWFLVGVILYPAVKTVELSLMDNGHFSPIHFVRLFTDPAARVVVLHSVILGCLTVLICGIIGTTLAFFVHFFEFRWKQLIDKLLLLPIMLPGIIIVFSFVQLYGESGLITKTLESLFGLHGAPYTFAGLPGILFVHAYTQYVYFYIGVSIAIGNIDYSTVENARSLGASKVQIATSVLLPFITPALVASGAITFMSGIGSFTAPSIIGEGYKVLTTQILLSKANNYMDVASAQVVVLTCISMFFFFIFRHYEKRKRFATTVKGVPIQPIRIRNPVARTLVLLMFYMLVLLILLPIVTIVLLSFVKSGSWMVSIYPREFTLENYADILLKSRKLAPFQNSVVMALLAAMAGLLIAVPSSYLIKKTQLRIRWAVEMLIMLPWAMPGSAIAINMINAYNRPNPFSFHFILVGSFILLPLGYLLRSLTIMVETTNISFQSVNDSYIEAAKSLGSTSSQTFRKVVVPLLSPGLFAGFLLLFIRSIGEYTVSAFLYNASNQPVSIAMVNSIFEYNIGLAMAYGALLVLVAMVLSLAISRLSSLSLRHCS